MHEELKKDFVEEFRNLTFEVKCPDCDGSFTIFEKTTNNCETCGDFGCEQVSDSEPVWQWIESKLPKEVEIKLVEEQTYYRCPNCDIWLSNADGSDEEDDYTDNYCPNCGSKINWK